MARARTAPRCAVLVAAALAPIAAPVPSLAQGMWGPAGDDRRGGLEVVPRTGLFWSTQVSTAAGPIRTGLAPELGLSVGWPLAPAGGPGPATTGRLELLYAYANPSTTFTATSPSAPNLAPFSVRYQYFQAGGVAGFPDEGFEPYAAMSVGAVWISPVGVTRADGTPALVGDAWLFAATLGGGLRVPLTRVLALDVGARLFLPVVFSSAAFFSGPEGAALVVNGGIPLAQGDLTVGLAVAP